MRVSTTKRYWIHFRCCSCALTPHLPPTCPSRYAHAREALNPLTPLHSIPHLSTLLRARGSPSCLVSGRRHTIYSFSRLLHCKVLARLACRGRPERRRGSPSSRRCVARLVRPQTLPPTDNYRHARVSSLPLVATPQKCARAREEKTRNMRWPLDRSAGNGIGSDSHACRGPYP